MLNLARELRRSETKAESFLWERLRKKRLFGFKFRRQHQFGNYIVDFYCRQAQLVIECDGSVHDTNESWQHDRSRDAYMVGQGLRVLRFSNDEVLNNIDGLVARIVTHLLPLPLTLPTNIK